MRWTSGLHERVCIRQFSAERHDQVRANCNRFVALPENEKAAVIAFLSSLRVVPEK